MENRSIFLYPFGFSDKGRRRQLPKDDTMVVMKLFNASLKKKNFTVTQRGQMQRHESVASLSAKRPKGNLSDFQENFATRSNSNGLYLKPTQVGKLKILRGAR